MGPLEFDFERTGDSRDDWIRSTKAIVSKKIGRDVHDLIDEFTVAQRYLNDADPRQRIMAIFVLNNLAPVSEPFASACEALAANDPDSNVRKLAMRVLARHYAKSRNVRICRLLADIWASEAEPDDVRAAAQECFYLASDRPVSSPDRLQELERYIEEAKAILGMIGDRGEPTGTQHVSDP